MENGKMVVAVLLVHQAVSFPRGLKCFSKERPGYSSKHIRRNPGSGTFTLRDDEEKVF